MRVRIRFSRGKGKSRYLCFGEDFYLVAFKLVFIGFVYLIIRDYYMLVILGVLVKYIIMSKRGSFCFGVLKGEKNSK